MARRQKIELPVYETKLVFAAACAAQRINNDYVKFPVISYEDDNEGEVIIESNKVLVNKFIKDTTNITEEDYEMADRVISYCNQVTFKILAGNRINDFEQTMMEIAAKENIIKAYDIAVISSLPASYLRSIERRNVQDRLNDCSGFAGKVGEKVSITGEVVRCNYNQEYGIYFVTVITNDNKQVFFAFRNKLEIGSIHTFTGKVKAHRDTATQLNYVKMT